MSERESTVYMYISWNSEEKARMVFGASFADCLARKCVVLM